MIIEIKVQTKSDKSRLVKTGTDQYKAGLKSAPVNNKANEELIALIAQQFGLKRHQIDIIRGLTARTKLISIDK